MGFFSNGTEGMDYEGRYCSRCIHQDGCAVWLAHMLRNYEECNNKDSILHLLIPRSADGLTNEQCRMFIAVGAMHKGKVMPGLEDWAQNNGIVQLA